MSVALSLRKPVDASGVATMLVLCVLWGFNYVAVKVVASDVSMVMQSGIRTAAAALLVLAWMRSRGIAVLDRDGTGWAGLLAGLLFAGEFAFIFAGLALTGASRMTVFVYLSPCFTALGLHWLVASERLRARQWLGIGVAFAGVVVAFADGFSSAPGSWRGDLFGVAAAALWGATTVVIRTTPLAAISPSKTLFYQLAVGGVSLPLVSWALGEPGVVAWTPLAVASLVYQSAIVAFASYLTWFWLLTRYLAARLSVFTFLTPIFGIACAAAFLGEPIRPAFLAAVALVGAGIYLVNQRKG